MRITIFNEFMMKEETYELCVKGAGLNLPTLEEMGVDKNKPMRLTRVFFFKEQHSIMNTPLAEIEKVIRDYYDIDDNMIVETTIRRALYPETVYDGVVGFTLENLTEEVEVEEEEVVVEEDEEEKGFFSTIKISAEILEAERDSLISEINTLQEQLKELKHRRRLLRLIPFKTAKVKTNIELLDEEIICILDMIYDCKKDRNEITDKLLEIHSYFRRVEEEMEKHMKELLDSRERINRE